MSLPTFHLKNTVTVLMLALILLLNSCYTYRVATNAQAGSESSKPITVNSFFWGLVKKPTIIHTPLCDSLQVNGMAEVTMKTNFGYALITVITLGIWSPMKVEWKCSKPCKKSGSL